MRTKCNRTPRSVWRGNWVVVLFFFGVLLFTTAQPLRGADHDQACNKQTAVAVVHSMATGLGEGLKNIKEENDRRDFIRSFVDPIRFFPDKSGYFFVYTYDCLNIALPIPKDLEGKNLYDQKDRRGTYMIRELSAAAKEGGGFVEYYWLKPGTQKEAKKISYAEPIPGTNYFIGTGFYLR